MVVATGTHRDTAWQVESDGSGTFTATWKHPGRDRPYWALAGQGHRFASEALAKSACEETIDKMIPALAAQKAKKEAEEADETPAHTAALHAITGMGVSGPGGIYKPDAETAPEGEHCVQCGRPGMWISGAGRVLCVRHQDNY